MSTTLTGNIAKNYFNVFMKNTSGLMKADQNVVPALGLIEQVFIDLASDKTEVIIGTRTVRKADLGAVELASLCKLSKKFFKNNKNLNVSKDLLSSIEKLKHTPQYNEFYTGDYKGNLSSLDSLKELIYLNECPETTSGVRVQLQKDLLKEIQDNAKILKKEQRMSRIKQVLSIAIGVGACIGIIGILGATLGFAAAFVATLLVPFVIALPIWWGLGLRSREKVKDAEIVQHNRFKVFELLNDPEEFNNFCEWRELDPEKVTVESLLKNLYKKAEVAAE